MKESADDSQGVVIPLGSRDHPDMGGTLLAGTKHELHPDATTVATGQRMVPGKSGFTGADGRRNPR